MKKNDQKFGYRFLRGILLPVFKFYYNPKMYGAENIPKDGNILICGNHKHIMDQCMPIMGTKRMIHWMAKREYFDDWKVAWFFKLAGCIPVDRSIKDPFTFARTNVMGTLSLLQAAKLYWEAQPEKYEGKRFYHISTDEVYGSLGETGYFLETTPYDPRSPYSSSM